MKKLHTVYKTNQIHTTVKTQPIASDVKALKGQTCTGALKMIPVYKKKQE